MNELLSVTELCALTKKSDKTIRKKLSGLQPKPGPKGAKLYDPSRALSLIYSDTDLLSVERAKLTKLQAEKVQLEIDKFKGQWVEIEEVGRQLDKEYAIVRTQLRSLHTRVVIPLTRTSDPHEISKIIRDEINEILGELVADATYRLEILERQAQRDRKDVRETGSPDSEGHPSEADSVATVQP